MNLKSRKLIGGIVLIILATIVVLTDAMTADLFDKWSFFVFLIYSSYVAGNVSTKFAHNTYNNLKNNNHE